MKAWMLIGLAGLAGCATASGPKQTQPAPMVPVFDDASRQTATQFWAQPDRLSVLPPSDMGRRGLYRVRLTANGSKWLYGYIQACGIKGPPTVDPKNSNPLKQGWDAWIDQKISYDRWVAYQVAQKFNSQLNLPTDPLATGGLPAVSPGPCPPALAALAGNPPCFAEATPVSDFVVKFDDWTVEYQDHVGVRQRYAYFRFDSGVDDEGKTPATLGPDRLRHLFKLAGATDTQAHVMLAVSPLEGGFDAINTYDTGYVSIGFIQFASLREGGGSLGTMLLDYKTADPADFHRDFTQYGIDVTPKGILAVVDPETGVEVQGPDANIEIIDDKRLTAVFQRAGQRSDAFMAAQIRSALQQFYPAADLLTFSLNGEQVTCKVGDVIHSEAGLATLFDRKVNTGGLLALPKCIAAVASEHDCTSMQDLAAYEGEIIARLKYRKNFLADSGLTQPMASSQLDPSLTSRHGGHGRKSKN